MKIKERITRAAITKLEKRLKTVKAILEEKPLSAICELRIKAIEIMEQHKGDYGKIGELIEPLAKEEKRLFRVAKKQQGQKLWDEQLQLETDLCELQNELYYIGMKNSNMM